MQDVRCLKVKAGRRAVLSQIDKFINSIWNKNELPEQWKESIIVHVYKKGNTKDCSNYTGLSLLSNMYKISSNICSQGKLHMERKLLRIIRVYSDATGQLLITWTRLIWFRIGTGGGFL